MRISLKHIVILNLTQIIFICLIIGLYLFSSEIRITGNINYLNESLNKREIYSIKKVSIPRNLIWEQLNENVFFKRTSAFFIIERLLLRLYYVSADHTDYEYNAILNIIEKLLFWGNVRTSNRSTIISTIAATNAATFAAIRATIYATIPTIRAANATT